MLVLQVPMEHVGMSLSISPPASGKEAMPSPQAPRPLDVLVVDDEEDQFVLVRRLLARFSSPTFNVAWAENYSSGLRLLEGCRFDVALVDYRLGLMNGVDLIREAKTVRPDMPFILVTGAGDLEVDMSAMAAGAIDYLSKSTLDGSTLERAIRYATRQQALANLVERQGDHVEALDAISQILAREGPSSAGLDRVLEVMDERLGHGSAAVYVLHGDQLALGAVHGFAKPIVSTPSSSGPLRRVLSEGKPGIIPSWTETDAGIHEACEYTLPLTFEERRVGLLTVAISADRPLGSADQRVLIELAARVGNAMGLHEERAWLGERRLGLRRATTFAESGIAETPGPDHLERVLALVQLAFPADGLAFAAPDGDGTLLVRSAIGSVANRVGETIGQPHSPAERALAGRTVQVDSSGISCAAFTPVVTGSELLGLLWVDRRGMAATYTAQETELLALLGAELGMVMSIAQVRGLAMRDARTGLYTRPFLEALIETDAAMNDQRPVGLVLVAPRFPDQASLKDEEALLESLVAVATSHQAGGPDVIAQYGPAAIAILVRELASDRAATLARALAAVSVAEGRVEVAAGWAVRSSDALHTLPAAADMALELSRRTRGAVEG